MAGGGDATNGKDDALITAQMRDEDWRLEIGDWDIRALGHSDFGRPVDLEIEKSEMSEKG